ncbi:MAG TPA: hypothetical protein VFH68_14190 [Polyangia bacterium]|nr:hypothetical protein [Polyangia bacterium]
MSDEIEVLRIVAQRLATAQVEYMLTGSVAMSWYAQPRQTRDVDIVIDLPAAKINTVVDAFSADFYIDADVVRDEVKRRGMFNMIQDALVVKVDMILRKSGAHDIEAFRRRRDAEIAPGLNVRIIAPEDLILAKLAWAAQGESDLQIRDVRNLLVSVQELDQSYLSHWAGRLGVAELLEKATSP